MQDFYNNITNDTVVSKGTTALPTSDLDRTKESSRYNVSGAEGDVETHTTTHPCTKATVDVGYVT